MARFPAPTGVGPKTLAVGRGMVLILALGLAAGAAGGEVALTLSGGGDVPLGAGATFAVRGEGVVGLGALQFEVQYSAPLLKFREVKSGPALAGAMIETKEVSSGRLKIAIACGQAVEADGVLLTVKFDDLGRTGNAVVMLEKARAWNEETLAPLVFKNGGVDTGNVRFSSSNGWIFWALGGGIGLLLLLLLLFVFGLSRRSSPLAHPQVDQPVLRPASAPAVLVQPSGARYPPPVSSTGSSAVCPRCQAALAANAAFCSKCGQAVPQPAAVAAFCAQCGKPLAPGARFCAGCGAAATA